MGITMAFFSWSGMIPLVSELFTTITIKDMSESSDLVNNCAGIGSRGHDLMADFFMIFVNDVGVTGVKATKLHVNHETESGM